MDTKEFLAAMDGGEPVRGGGPVHQEMHRLSQEAVEICSRINGGYHEPAELRALMAELCGRPVPDDFSLFPPFTADCGKNIHIGRGVFINSGCRFQDQGGIYLGDGALIGHNVVIATLNHPLEPALRHGLEPSPVHVGANAWIGAGAILLPGTTVGENAVVAAGAVVTRDVPANTVVAGVPAKAIRTL
ncbi:DapH/DapD/GlmU-related protein [Caniella muris]|uniref:DapH/DapD/GlmU-related protein n=1 Tax=Caniella muris TaxID=2941502 RepID=UPI00203E946A|nr:DapH/DapD/GlmU-related protein [Caniella muris]